MQQTIFAPYLRTSPLHTPRRDLALAASDSLYLRVTIVESDKPDAQLLTLTGGLDGPQAQLLIWTDRAILCGGCCDYERPLTAGGSVLWSAMGTPQAGLGSFDFTASAGTLSNLPLRCGWGMQLGWSATKSDLLFSGILNVGMARFGPIPPVITPIATDDEVFVLQDDAATFTLA